jgi:hypothetical protein
MSVRFGQFIARVRGNPIALATLLVAIVSAFLAFSLATPNKEVVAGALIGASVSSVVALLINFLGEPDLRDVPRAFLEAAKHDVINTGYYRTDHKFTIVFSKINRKGLQQDSIEITFSSTIIPVRENVRIKQPIIRPPSGVVIEKQEYKIDGHGISSQGEIALERSKKEKCLVIYIIEDRNMTVVEDVHRWTCPVDGFSVTTQLPEGYDIEIFGLKGDHRPIVDQEDSHLRNQKRFSHRGGAFSHQGFVWNISKVGGEGNFT